MSAKKMRAEERLIWANQVYAEMIRKIVKAIEEKYGPEGKEIALNALCEVGRDVATKIRNILKITGKEPIDCAKLLYYQDTNLWAMKEEVTPRESGEAIIRASYCPVQEMFTAKDCAIFVPYIRSMLDVINPNLRWKVNKVLTRGDDCCEFIIIEEEGK